LLFFFPKSPPPNPLLPLFSSSFLTFFPPPLICFRPKWGFFQEQRWGFLIRSFVDFPSRLFLPEETRMYRCHNHTTTPDHPRRFFSRSPISFALPPAAAARHDLLSGGTIIYPAPFPPRPFSPGSGGSPRAQNTIFKRLILPPRSISLLINVVRLTAGALFCPHLLSSPCLVSPSLWGFPLATWFRSFSMGSIFSFFFGLLWPAARRSDHFAFRYLVE